MIDIIINGKKVAAKEGQTILQVCREIGIDIPTLCYDERLEAHAACRLCVVEVEGMKNLTTSCSMKVSEGMVIQTHSDRVVEARKDILNMMWANHPNDCLTCEKSGKCELQKYCYEYDVKENIYGGYKKRYTIDESNPFYYNDQNKCINCGKCVRVCDELQCTHAISFNERGFDTHVGVPFDIGIENSDCVSCGNCVSICPVGALMPKSKNKFRYWDVKRVRTTCSYCGVGCQMNLLIKDNKVVEVEPVNGPSNEGLLCVKGKFGFNFLNHPDRLKKPLIRKDGKLVESTWNEAYKLITEKITDIKDKHGADSLAGFTSARCTNEENYLFQKLFRAVIGTNNVDHCARL